MDNNNPLNEENNHLDLIADDVAFTEQYVYASQGQRFLNYLIDNLLMRFVLSYASGILIGTLIAAISPEFIEKIAYQEAAGVRMSGAILFISFLIAYLNYIIYYTLCEKLFKGYTLGKLITGTKAIRQDGGELTFKNTLYRSLSRCVPFEVFSGFKTLTWHDAWTDTMVIKTR